MDHLDREKAGLVLQAIGESASIPNALAILPVRVRGEHGGQESYLLTVMVDTPSGPRPIPVALLDSPQQLLQTFEPLTAPSASRILGSDGQPTQPSRPPALYLPEAAAQARRAIAASPLPSPPPAIAKPKLYQPPPVDAAGRRPWEVPMQYNTAQETAASELEFDEPVHVDARHTRVNVEEPEGPEEEEEETPPDERPDWDQEYPQVPPTLPDREDPYPVKAAEAAAEPSGSVRLNDYNVRSTDTAPIDYRRGPHSGAFGV